MKITGFCTVNGERIFTVEQVDGREFLVSDSDLLRISEIDCPGGRMIRTSAHRLEVSLFWLGTAFCDKEIEKLILHEPGGPGKVLI